MSKKEVLNIMSTSSRRDGEANSRSNSENSVEESQLVKRRRYHRHNLVQIQEMEAYGLLQDFLFKSNKFIILLYMAKQI